MTPSQKLGYKVGQKFRVTSDKHHRIKKGEIVTLYKDDGTGSPFFKGRDFEWAGKTCMCLDKVEPVIDKPIEERPVKLQIGDKIKIKSSHPSLKHSTQHLTKQYQEFLRGAEAEVSGFDGDTHVKAKVKGISNAFYLKVSDLHHVELVQEEKKMSFKVGDVVKLKDTANGWSFKRESATYTVVKEPTAFAILQSRGKVGLSTVEYWPEDFELAIQQPEFKAMKFIVRNAKHSRQIQETLFAQGYKWGMGGAVVWGTQHRALFTDAKGIITWGRPETVGNDDQELYLLQPRTTYEFVKAPEPKAPVKQEVVELNGKKYLKKDLEEALKKLTPAGGK